MLLFVTNELHVWYQNDRNEFYTAYSAYPLKPDDSDNLEEAESSLLMIEVFLWRGDDLLHDSFVREDDFIMFPTTIKDIHSQVPPITNRKYISEVEDFALEYNCEKILNLLKD